MLKKIDSFSVLVPATPMGRSIFSRVAVKLNCGLTADCTELLVAQREDGTYYIKQNKPSFGENVFVTIVTKEGYYPQMMTVRPGVYTPYEGEGSAEVTILMISHFRLPRLRLSEQFLQKQKQTVSLRLKW